LVGVDFQIVACGPVVKQIATDPQIQGRVNQAVTRDPARRRCPAG
jgi:hypothetical protein